jgi:hypothetical protein
LYHVEPGVTEDPQGRANIAKVQDDVRAAGSRLAQRQHAIEQADALLNILKSYKTGHFAAEKSELLSVLKGLGIDVPDKAWGPGWSDTDFQTFSTGVMKDVLGEVKDIGGVRGNAGIRALERSAASARLEPDANLNILSRLRGGLEFDNQYDRDLVELNRGVNSAGGALQSHSAFDANWNQQNRLGDYVQDVKQNTPVVGHEEPEERPPGAPFEWSELNPFDRTVARRNVQARLAQRRWDAARDEPVVKAMMYGGIPLVAGAALWAAYPTAVPAAWAAFKASGLAGKVAGGAAAYGLIKMLPETVREDALSLVEHVLGGGHKGGGEEQAGGRVYARGGRVPNPEAAAAMRRATQLARRFAR